jgi:uncharacterized protein with NAD-binding domain and iron-sulfur cluster
MTTEDLIEEFISAGVDAFKKNHRNSPQGIKLDRHEPVEIDGIEFRCWRELAVYGMAEWLRDELPDSDIEVVMDGNDSTLSVSMDDGEQRKVTGKMYAFLKKYGCI